MGRLTFGISLQEYTGNDLRIQKFSLRGMPPDPPSRRTTRALIAYWNPPFQNSRSATAMLSIFPLTSNDVSSVVHGYKCSHFFHFRPDDDWSIQSKRRQVIFRAQVGNKITFLSITIVIS